MKISIDTEAVTITKTFEDARTKATDAGVENPRVSIEPHGMMLYVSTGTVSVVVQGGMMFLAQRILGQAPILAILDVGVRMHIDIDAEAKVIEKSLKRMLAKAKDAGVENPRLYIESAGSVYLLDGDHPDYSKETHERRNAIVGSARLLPELDVGAW